MSAQSVWLCGSISLVSATLRVGPLPMQLVVRSLGLYSGANEGRVLLGSASQGCAYSQGSGLPSVRGSASQKGLRAWSSRQSQGLAWWPPLKEQRGVLRSRGSPLFLSSFIMSSKIVILFKQVEHINSCLCGVIGKGKGKGSSHLKMLVLSVIKNQQFFEETSHFQFLQAIFLLSPCLWQYFIQNHFWMRLCVSTEATIKNSSRTRQSSHLITPFLSFCSALSTTRFDSKLVLPINFACQISKQNNYGSFFYSPILFCCASSHKVNICFFVMISSWVVVISPCFYLYSFSGRKWLMVMEVRVKGFNLQGIDYFFLVEVGELDSLIFQSRNWANFYRLIIKIIQSLYGSSGMIDGKQG